MRLGYGAKKWSGWKAVWTYKNRKMATILTRGVHKSILQLYQKFAMQQCDTKGLYTVHCSQYLKVIILEHKPGAEGAMQLVEKKTGRENVLVGGLIFKEAGMYDSYAIKNMWVDIEPGALKIFTLADIQGLVIAINQMISFFDPDYRIRLSTDLDELEYYLQQKQIPRILVEGAVQIFKDAREPQFRNPQAKQKI